MNKYLGTKEVLAKPMTRGEYNDYRGWGLPANENPDEEGYLVEYLDGGKPCDDRHAGYISWSPADVFLKANKPYDTWLDRLKVELEDEQGRLDKLSHTLNQNKPDQISEDQWVFMSRQQFHMRMTCQILQQRIDLAEGKTIAPAATRKIHLQGSEDLT